jgi:hypothetical protein
MTPRNHETARRRLTELLEYWKEHRQTCLGRLNDPNANRMFERQAQTDLERVQALELAITLIGATTSE